MLAGYAIPLIPVTFFFFFKPAPLFISAYSKAGLDFLQHYLYTCGYHYQGHLILLWYQKHLAFLSKHIYVLYMCMCVYILTHTHKIRAYIQVANADKIILMFVI